MAHSCEHSNEHRRPEISCGCGHCHGSEAKPQNAWTRALDALAEAIEQKLPARARTWFCHAEDEARRDFVCIAASFLLLLVAVLLGAIQAPVALRVFFFVVAYLAVGIDILMASVRNIRAGDFFDENLLMSVASLGAFALGEYPEAVAVMLFYRVGEFFEDRAVDRSRNQIMDAVDMRPETVNVLSDFTGAAQNRYEANAVAAADVLPGNFVLIRPGERIPLDGTVVEGESRIDTSPVTGEPVPVKVGQSQQVVSGCINETSQLVVRVDKPLSESMVTRILDAVEHAAASKPRIERFITRFARVYTPVVIAIAAATAVIPSLLGGNWHQWVYTACTFLVISCPCAIVLSVPLAFFAGIGAASKKGILFKGGNVIEALGKVRAVVMDKTGTITKGVFAVQQVAACPGFSENDVLRMAASVEQSSTHPIAQSIVAAAKARALPLARAMHVNEQAGFGLEADLALDSLSVKVAVGKRELLEQAGVAVTDADDDGAHAATRTYVAADGICAGTIEISDALKDDSVAALSQLRQAGIHTAMLTGDAQRPAEAVAQAAGIDEVHTQLLPEEKVEMLKAVRASHGSAMFVGDGINDAPVLAAADVGAAMGSGSDAAIEAADVVFMTSSLSAIPVSLSLASKVHRVAAQNIVFALAVKLGIMVLGFAGIASMWAAVFADVGVALLCILNSVRLLRES